jgi:chromate transporter
MNEPSTLRAFVAYFLRLGTIGFGGPIALAGYMQRDLVERRRWISEQDYKEGLALAQLAPGPLAAQLAIYLGWSRGGVIGATLVAVAFIAPSFLMVLGLSALYVRFDGLPWMLGAFYGVGAAVIAVIVRATVKLARLTLGETACCGRSAWSALRLRPGRRRRSFPCSSELDCSRSRFGRAPVTR